MYQVWSSDVVMSPNVEAAEGLPDIPGFPKVKMCLCTAFLV